MWSLVVGGGQAGASGMLVTQSRVRVSPGGLQVEMGRMREVLAAAAARWKRKASSL